MSSETIFLNMRDSYDVGGKVVTLHQIQKALLDQQVLNELKKDLKEGRI